MVPRQRGSGKELTRIGATKRKEELGKTVALPAHGARMKPMTIHVLRAKAATIGETVMAPQRWCPRWH